DGDRLYVAAGDAGLRIMDVSDPGAPFEIGAAPTPDRAMDVAVRGDHVFVAVRYAGLVSFDALNPSAPAPRDTLPLGDEPLAVALLGDVAYVASGGDGLYVIDAADPAALSVISQLPVPGYAQGLACGADYLYVAAGSAGLRVLDVADPAAPYQTGWFTTAYARGLSVDWRDVLLADGFDGVRLLRNDMIVPVLLTEFAASWRDGAAELRWRLHGDADPAGCRLARREAGVWATVAYVTSSLGSPAVFVDGSAPRAGARYGLLAAARDGGESLLGETVLAAAPPTPLRLRVAPNPFNPRTTVSFVLTQPGQVSLRVYDAAGRLVRRLHDEPMPAGDHAIGWDGRDAAGRPLPGAAYFVRLVTDRNAQASKVLLLK
ncbi:hypothetical protein KKA85_06735, partial [bacterium]|nr:hypothetical protein [bacterium]